VIACGYKGKMIRDYFRDRHDADNNWRVALEDTGLDTPTAGRILRLRDALKAQRFFLTYGDGVSNVDLAALLSFHVKHGRLATVTAVRPPARFGALELVGDRVREFSEKPHVGEGWINGGFFVFEPGALAYMREDAMLERAPLERLAEDRQLMAFRHEDFWQCMDTLRDKQLLESLWASGNAPWLGAAR
jgi:glucose-1-phosphate cytidylyltransferase